MSYSYAGVVPALLEPLRDANEEKQWSVALGDRDCKRLMELLLQNPRLWMKPDSDDRNVFHVAVMQGCVKLIKQVLEAPADNVLQFRKDVKKLLSTKDGKCRADAFCLAAIVGVQRVIGFLKPFEPTEKIGSIHSATSHHDGDFQTTNAFVHYDDSGSNADDAISKLIEQLPRSPLLEDLEQQMKFDVDYNFDEDRKGLIFNFAWKHPLSNKDFILSVVEKAKENGLLFELFNQMDSQGRPPLHVATDFCCDGELQGIDELLDVIPEDCLNGFDSAGRTPLLRAVANGMNLSTSQLVRVLAKDPRTNLNAKWPGQSGATALHMAVLHNHAHTAKFLMNARPRKNESYELDKENRMTRKIKVFKYQWYDHWTALELAAVMGRFGVLLQLLQASGTSLKPLCDQYCLHLAAAAGDPRSIQALLMYRNDHLQNFEKNQYFGGYSCLHFAVNATLPHQPSKDGMYPSLKAIDPAFDRFLAFPDFASIYWLEKELTSAGIKGPQKVGMTVIGYGGKKSCTNLLLQAGVDIWPSRKFVQPVSEAMAHEVVDTDGEFLPQDQSKDFHTDPKDRKDQKDVKDSPAVPDPGSDACDDDRLWWYGVVAKETLEAKNSFNAAGNATAVVGTLVATASFVGPFSPPLGYISFSDASGDLEVLMARLPIRIFMTSNSLSFYLAIASVMLAIMPSLPMPQEGQREELHRSERTVALAISVLLVSILGNLVSFTACVIAVLPNSYWSYKFYPPFVGGIVLSWVIFVFFLRLLRLVFNRNTKIKSFYRLFGKL